jgi:hypothetical protein
MTSPPFPLRNFDSSTFNAWFIAFTLNNPQKEAFAARRFRPAFRVAFNAWMATDPLHNPKAPPGPTYMPQYKLPSEAQAKALDNQASAKFQDGNRAGLVSDNYVRITVFLAAVLFLVGIGSSFKLHGVRYALIALGSVLLLLSLALILHQPGCRAERTGHSAGRPSVLQAWPPRGDSFFTRNQAVTWARELGLLEGWPGLLNCPGSARCAGVPGDRGR